MQRPPDDASKALKRSPMGIRALGGGGEMRMRRSEAEKEEEEKVEEDKTISGESLKKFEVALSPALGLGL